MLHAHDHLGMLLTVLDDTRSQEHCLQRSQEAGGGDGGKLIVPCTFLFWYLV